MGQVTKWDAGSLDELQANLQTAYSTMEESTTELEQKLQAKFETWEGDAREAYTEAKAQWDQALAEFNEVIQQLGQAVIQIKDSFQTTERSNAQTFG